MLRPDGGTRRLGRLEAKHGNVEAARACYAAACEHSDSGGGGGSSVTLQAWALVEAQAGATDVARELFRAALKADPMHAAAWQVGSQGRRPCANYLKPEARAARAAPEA